MKISFGAVVPLPPDLRPNVLDRLCSADPSTDRRQQFVEALEATDRPRELTVDLAQVGRRTAEPPLPEREQGRVRLVVEPVVDAVRVRDGRCAARQPSLVLRQGAVREVAHRGTTVEARGTQLSTTQRPLPASPTRSGPPLLGSPG